MNSKSTKSRGQNSLSAFGEDDARTPPPDAAERGEALDKHGKSYAFHMYPAAGHGCFAVDWPSYRQQAAVDGWKKLLDWFGGYLRSDPASEGA